MSEKLRLHWNGFKENVNSAFGRLRCDNEFADVTLVCEDGQQMEAHKVILAASSPFFEKIFLKSRHPHPLVYLRGFHSQDLEAILDFLYYGEAKVFQENLDSFLAIAEELEIKGLLDQVSDGAAMVEQGPSANNQQTNEYLIENSAAMRTSLVDNGAQSNLHDTEEASTVVPLKNEFVGDFKSQDEREHILMEKSQTQFRDDINALNERVKSLMERGQNMVPNGPNKQTKAFICKVCGKEGRPNNIRNHIENRHLFGRNSYSMS